MSKIAIISDPHANLEALIRVLDDIEDHSVDEIICTGDLIGYGPQPQECCDLAREREITVLQGNHEQGLINIYHLQGFNQPAKDALRKTRAMISDETYTWLVSHPKSLVRYGCRFVHGLPPDSVTEYLWKHEHSLEQVFPTYPEQVCFVGHTHDLMRFTYGKGVCSERLPLPEGELQLDPTLRHLVNVGAVGQPRDGNNAAKYVLFDTETLKLTVRFIQYDIQKTVDRILACGLHRGFADRLW
ncbi:Metallophosphoesterase [Pseudodesulfovibrio profundus]|uniref:Metallophosphoesterase n=1 Tax=Pseudodesulfovibrio profundus TaxID=57320 RepID=A0A2C8F7A1_9BACT|nr:metallophosphoesterase family protein [Pseudodesulfovibrio profundus]SOB58628.1 Metallophosphoesterase [Pseudodesulfovibrio profundus]